MVGFLVNCCLVFICSFGRNIEDLFDQWAGHRLKHSNNSAWNCKNWICLSNCEWDYKAAFKLRIRERDKGMK